MIKKEFDRGKKTSVSVRDNAKSRLELLVSDTSSVLANTETGLAGLILHPLTSIC